MPIILNQKRRINIWNNVERSRKSYLLWGTALFQKILKKQTNEAVSLIEKANDRSEITDIKLEKIFDPKEIHASVKKVYYKVGGNFAKEIFKAIKKKKSLQIKQVTDEFWEDVFQHNADIYLSGRPEEKSAAIARESLRIIKSRLTAGFNEGMSIQDMARLMRDEIPGMDYNRAVRIARTEVISASNFGAMQGAEMTGLALNKEWIATPDSRTRPDHADADGQTTRYAAPFNVGGEDLDFPGDSSLGASAENIINCRCTVAFISI